MSHWHIASWTPHFSVSSFIQPSLNAMVCVNKACAGLRVTTSPGSVFMIKGGNHGAWHGEAACSLAVCARTPLHHVSSPSPLLPTGLCFISPLLIPDISWAVSHCPLVRRRRVLQVVSSTAPVHISEKICQHVLVMQSMAERMQVTNDVDGTTSGTHEVHSMYTAESKV